MVPSFVFYLLLGCIYVVLVMFVKHTQPLMVVGLYFFLVIGGVFLIMLKISNILAFCVFMTNVSGLLVLISYCMALHPVDKKLDSGSSSSVIFNKKRKGESGQKPVFNFTYLFFKGFPVFKMNKGVIGKPGKVKSEELGNFNMISSLVYPLVVMSLVFLLVMFVSWNGPVESMYPMFRFVWSFAMTPLWIVCIAGLSLFVFIVIVGCVSICSKYHGALVGESWKKKSSKVTSN